MLIVQIQHGEVWRCCACSASDEEPLLGGKVGFHGAVVVKVVAGKVGEDGNFIADAPSASLLQRVAAHFHHRLAHTGRDCVLQQGIERVCLWSGVAGWQLLPCQVHLNGAQQKALAASGGEHCFQQEGCGRLAIGAGHPGHAEPPFRVPGERSRNVGQCVATVLAERCRDGRICNHKCA